MRVVIIDNEPLVCEVLTDQLQLRGHTVACFTRPEAALSALRQQGADVILCDILMPEMNGMELYRRLSQCDSALAARILFITGDGLGSDVTVFFEATDSLHIIKPFRYAHLEARIGELLHRVGAAPNSELRQAA